MKSKFFPLLVFILILNHLQASPLSPQLNTTTYYMESARGQGGDPDDIKVVFSQKRIWLVADETPMKCLKASVKNADGKLVLEKCFTSKTAEWSMNIESLPKGAYTLHLGEKQIEKFSK